MSAENLVVLLKKILTLHQNLLKLSERKTDILKKGDIDALNDQMKEEQKYILAIKQLENERIAVVNQLLGPRVQDKTLSKCIEMASGPVRLELTGLHEELVKVTHDLKVLNELNQQLTHQSLQYVNMSLDMLLPQEQNAGYGNPAGTKEKKQTRSMFDSKA
ncbi:flagellar protein FlgN [Bacillus timonensis]|uniref:Flagellar protein FlgN n=1 Tax=Bacillus timonensis TaxID=1033734 RepID=A0A4S3PRL6_9BACI|nr:flagellar protein FlgN [Bacillus timonensis]THE12341.1 flagellar protein FlgN [Bacillus timonensis]